MLLGKGCNKCKKHFTNRPPEKPLDIAKRYSCDFTKKICMFDKCTYCESGQLLGLDIQDRPSNLDFHSDSNGDHDGDVTFYKWETDEKHVKNKHQFIS